MSKQRYITQKKQWDFAMKYLESRGIKPINEQMTFCGTPGPRRLIIHSPALANCVIINAKMTEEQIVARIDTEIAIAKAFHERPAEITCLGDRSASKDKSNEPTPHKVQYWNNCFNDWITIDTKDSFDDTRNTCSLIEENGYRCRVVKGTKNENVVYETPASREKKPSLADRMADAKAHSKAQEAGKNNLAKDEYSLD